MFSKQKVFVLENILPSFGKIYWTTLRGELLGNFPKQSWVSLRDKLLDNSPRQFFGKSSFKFFSQPFSFFFHFLSCHALTPIYLGCPGAYEMHYAIFIQHMPIYHHAYINKIHIHTTCYLFMAITSKLAHRD